MQPRFLFLYMRTGNDCINIPDFYFRLHNWAVCLNDLLSPNSSSINDLKGCLIGLIN